MKQKTRILSLLAILFLLLVLPSASAFAASGSSGVWKSRDGKWYYYVNGKTVAGWQSINNKTYYFDHSDDDAMVTGFKKINVGGSSYTFYFMDKNYVKYNSSSEGQMLSGFKTISTNGRKNVYYFADNRYTACPKGAMLSGFKTIAGNRYYFADSRYTSLPKGARLSGFKTIAGKRYYFADSRLPSCKYKGKIVTGFNVIKNKVYYFSKSGVQQKNWAAKHPVVIDPGHSSDVADGQVPIGPGSSVMKDADTLGTRGISTGVYEYALNLKVSLKLRDALVKKGYKVIMVRTTNKGKYSCVKRAKIANKYNAAVFLRIHANAAPKDHSKIGAMTICITKSNKFIPSMYQNSQRLSDIILSNYVKATGCYNEGVIERDDMIANNWSKVPTTLIELGYMTNEAEDNLMQTSSYQKKMVNGLVNGIDAYYTATY